MLNKQIIITITILSAIIFGFFYETIFLDKQYFSGDSKTVRSTAYLYKEYVAKTGELPMWCPWIFGGIPVQGSLQYNPYGYFPDVWFKFIERNLIELTIIGLWILIRKFCLVYSFFRG